MTVSTARHRPHLLDSQEILEAAARQRRLMQARQDSLSLANKLAAVNAEAERLRQKLQLREASQDQPAASENIDDEEEMEVIETSPPSQRAYPRGRGGRRGRGAGGASSASSGH